MPPTNWHPCSTCQHSAALQMIPRWEGHNDPRPTRLLRPIPSSLNASYVGPPSKIPTDGGPNLFCASCRWKRSRPRHSGGLGDGADSLESFRGNAPNWNVGEFPVVTLSEPHRPDICSPGGGPMQRCSDSRHVDGVDEVVADAKEWLLCCHRMPGRLGTVSVWSSRMRTAGRRFGGGLEFEIQPRPLRLSLRLRRQSGARRYLRAGLNMRQRGVPNGVVGH